MNTQAWIEALGWTLVHFLWQGAAVAALLWVFLQFAFSQRPQLRYLASCGSLLLLVALAVGTFARETANAQRLHPEIATPTVPRLSPSVTPTALRSEPSVPAPTPATPAFVPIVSEPRSITTPPLTWHSFENLLEPLLPGIVAAWGIGVGLGFLQLCRSWNKVQRIRRSGHPLNESPWPASLERLCDLLRLSRPVRLVASAAVQVPMVIGWLKPVILLPCSIVTGLPREQVEAIVAHELAHIRRHDYLINVLQNVIETLFFFHLAVWWISGQIRREREHCCDDLASSTCGGALPYVTALAALEEACGAEQRLTVAANGGSLLARVRRLLATTPSEGPGNGSYAATVAALVLIVAAALPFALGQTPDAAPSVEEQSRAFERGTLKAQALADPQKDLPYGPASPIGLRAAWIFRPMKNEYAIGEALTSRVIIHNAGTVPVEFIANARLQDAQWSVVDANGTPIRLTETRYARAGEHRSRLAPGESLELPAFGLGIGPGEFDRVYEDVPIAMKLPAKAGGEYRCKWEVNLQAAWTLGDDEKAAKPVPVKLETGEIKFRVFNPPVDGPKPLGIAVKGGDYVISPGVRLRVMPIRMGPLIRIVNGVEKLPQPGEETKIKEVNFANLDVAADHSKSINVRLPAGNDTYVIAWERGGTTLWVGEADWVRKLDISAVGRFPAAELLETIDPLKREEVEKFLQNAGTGVPEQRWKWEDPGNFGGIPAHVRAALVQHRPKADSKAVAPEATYPLDAADPRLPWRTSGRVTDSKGKPMPDVEIWVHTGFGSLKRTGFVKTDASGRYSVNFGPGVLMEKDSTQLQVANITAHRPGFFEKNLSRHGQGAAAMRDVSAESLKDYGVTVEQLTLPNSPRQVDFVMLPAMTIKGKLVGTGSFPKLPPQDYRAKGSEMIFVDHEERNRTPLASWQVWLTGPKLPPGCSVFASAETDNEGRFEFKDVPTGFEWQIQADTHHRSRDPRSPLFKVDAPAHSTLEVELDEKQTGLKMLPAAVKPGAERSTPR